MTELEEVRQILTEPLETDRGNALSVQLSLRAAWQSRISALHREAEEMLSRKRGQLYPQESSEDKRRAKIDFLCAAEQRQVDELKDLADILTKHLSLGQSLLRSLEAERRSQ